MGAFVSTPTVATADETRSEAPRKQDKARQLTSSLILPRELPSQTLQLPGTSPSRARGISKHHSDDSEAPSTAPTSTQGSPEGSPGGSLGRFEGTNPRNPSSRKPSVTARASGYLVRSRSLKAGKKVDSSLSSPNSVTSTRPASTEPVKCPRGHNLSSGDAATADQKRIYDMRTWEMYLRITEARKKQPSYCTKAEHMGQPQSLPQPRSEQQDYDTADASDHAEDLIFHLDS